jgi:NAD(P)-dependent dehydrogenase (short-subunit alcohol dehydrogenase family)
VFITGCSTGIGRATVLQLAGRGYHVFAVRCAVDGVADDEMILSPRRCCVRSRWRIMCMCALVLVTERTMVLATHVGLCACRVCDVPPTRTACSQSRGTVAAGSA